MRSSARDLAEQLQRARSATSVGSVPAPGRRLVEVVRRSPAAPAYGMTKDVDWPGRGGTWLGVPALVALVIGLAIFLDASHRQHLSRELLHEGGKALCTSVQVEVFGGRANYIESIRVEFPLSNGRPVQTVLASFEDGRQGMAEGVHPPEAGTRYATPLQVVYRPSYPAVALAAVDAEKWAADVNTPRYGLALLVVGAGGVVWAPVMLSRSARRRGLAWWKWYSAGPRISP